MLNYLQIIQGILLVILAGLLYYVIASLVWMIITPKPKNQIQYSLKLAATIWWPFYFVLILFPQGIFQLAKFAYTCIRDKIHEFEKLPRR